MSFTTAFLITAGLILNIHETVFAQADVKEIKKEIKKLEKLRSEVKSLIQKNEKILKKIEEEKRKLEEERKSFEKYVKQVENERYKKLAKMFEKMEPELAGEKISNMEDPKKAAYIIYNMKESKAGEVLNYVSADMVNQITKILTQLKKQPKQTNQ
ncbi:hypothetical protein HG1285_04156 [Hydrogenivirga sp. 128-5-R1-1]|nr:hypothetical protein HG1285_04156 [Hydrogenivirga sp. 128-5-R1-1]